MNGGKATLIRGDALSLPLADETVSLVVTSPPYWALRSYTDGGGHYDGQLGSEPTPHMFLANLWRVLDECWRVLRADGSCWVNLGDKYAGSGASTKYREIGEQFKASRRNAPDRYLQTADYRPKSRLLLPHRFALGAIDPLYRAMTEQAAGQTPTPDPPQWILRMDAVWSKPNGMPESVTDRVRASHEYLFHLVKSERYYSALDEIREEHQTSYPSLGWPERKVLGEAIRHGVLGARGAGNHTPVGHNPFGKVSGSVWTIASEPLVVPDHLGVDHFAAFPSELPRRIIAGWSPPGICTRCSEGRRPVVEKRKDVYYGEGQFRNGAQQVKDGAAVVGWKQDEKLRAEATITGYVCACPTADAPTRPAVVVDPFAGTGTTCAVAKALGRHGVGVELSSDYLRLAEWRCQDPKLRAKVLGVEAPKAELAGQQGLFDDVA